jgi:Tol biopolymer transport system component
LPVVTGNQFIENLDVTWDGKWVTFASDLNGLTAIYKVPAAGGEPIRLTTDSVVNFAPSWSPDGGRIAYHRIKPNGNREVYVMNADGTDRQLRSSGLEQALVPAWSSTGDTLVVQTALSGNERVGIMPSSGPQSVRLVPLDVGGDMIVWSPTAYEFVVHATDGVRVASPAGGASRLVASNAGDGVEAFYSAWSRDGSTLYYLARGKAGWTIRTVSRTGGASRVLVRFDDPAHQPARYGFRTDGRRFYLTMGSNESDLWVMELSRR